MSEKQIGRPGRREIVLGMSSVLALGTLGVGVAPAAADGPSVRPRLGAGVPFFPNPTRGVPAPREPVVRTLLTGALDRYMATRTGVAGLAVRDNRNGRTYEWRPRTMQTHSAIKVLILVATLKVAQDRGVGLTSTQQAQASRMIRFSDNDATDALMRAVGAARCQRVADQLGMTGTTVLGGTVFRSSTWWGHSTASTRDLLALEDSVVRGTYLTSSRRASVRQLMGNVTSTQTWGLGDGLPSEVHVELKNGWGPRSDGYRLNGLGHVSGRGRSYQMSFLSRTPGGYSYGQATVNRLSRIVFDTLASPLD